MTTKKLTTEDRTRGEYPPLAQAYDSWLCWQYLDGKKQAHSPFSDLPSHSDDGPDKWSWSHPENLTDFDTAYEWAMKVPTYDGVGFILQDKSDPYKEPADPLVFIDLDDVVTDAGKVHPYAWMLVQRCGTYADLSVSGTGIHIIGVGELPEDTRTVQDTLPDHPDFPEAEVEVYDGKRFCAMTGKRLTDAPREVNDVTRWARRITRRFATTDPTGGNVDPGTIDVDNDVYADVDYTDDFDDIKDAIESVGRRDIRLDATETNERANGIIDYDPAHRTSHSGRGMAWFPDNEIWVDRDGQHYMDALQIVALEERIVSRPEDYPSGEDFWKALERLRERGANIPRYTNKDADRLGLHKTAETEEEEAEQFAKGLQVL